MESVRQQTEGSVRAKGLASLAHGAVPQAQQIIDKAAVDAELMSQATRVEKEMRSMDADDRHAAAKAATHHTALAAKSQISQRERAARYFAAHGMEKVGQSLGITAAKGNAVSIASVAEKT